MRGKPAENTVATKRSRRPSAKLLQTFETSGNKNQLKKDMQATKQSHNTKHSKGFSDGEKNSSDDDLPIGNWLSSNSGSNSKLKRKRGSNSKKLDENANNGSHGFHLSTDGETTESEKQGEDGKLSDDTTNGKLKDGPDLDGSRGDEGEKDGNKVKSWLNRSGLGKYAPIFEVHEVDDEILPFLTFEDLKDMGITAVGSRRKIYLSIEKLDKGSS